MNRYFFICLSLSLASGAVTSCGGSGGSGEASPVSGDSLPAAVTGIIRAVKANDAAAFASQVSYPLERPYPLRDIPDSVAMTRYFPTMIDAALRDSIAESGPSGWWRAGWRGWAMGDDAALMVDDKLYCVNHLSEAEMKLRRVLAAQELASLHESLRAGWDPVASFKGVDGQVFRIDRSTDGGDDEVYRLAVYPTVASISGRPDMILTGARSVEGSAMTEVYAFSGPSGLSVTYIPENPETESAAVVFSKAGAEDVELGVEPVYWLDMH